MSEWKKVRLGDVCYMNPSLENFKNKWNKFPCSLWISSVTQSFVLFPFFAGMSWAPISSEIALKTEQDSSKIKNPVEGQALAAFASRCMNGDNNASLSELVLEGGLECLKSIMDSQTDNNFHLNSSQKQERKTLNHDFIDFLGEFLKEQLKQEGRLV